MAYLWLGVGILVFIVLFIIFKTMLKAFFKLFLWVVLILLVVIGVIGFLVYNDANDFSKKFTTSNNLLLLEEQGKILTGVILHPGGEVTIFRNQEINKIRNSYSNGRYGEMLNDNYKLIVVNTVAFSEEGSITYEGVDLERKMMLDVLRDDDPIDVYLDGISEQLGVLGVSKEILRDSLLVTDEELKTSLFVLLYTEELGTNPLKMIIEYKRGNIIVYPETMMFKFIKYVPQNVVETSGLLNEKIYEQKITGAFAWLKRR